VTSSLAVFETVIRVKSTQTRKKRENMELKELFT